MLSSTAAAAAAAAAKCECVCISSRPPHTHCRCACAQVTNVGSAGNVHGPWGNDVTEVSIEIALFAGTAFCEVSWRQWAIDSRDDEEDSVSIDDEKAWSMVINHLTLSVSQARREVVSQNDSVSAYPLSADQGCGNMGWNDGPADFPAPWGGAGGACFDEITVQVPSCAAPNLNNGPNHLGLRWAVLLDVGRWP